MASKQDQDRGKKTLVLDLDETLVHSSFKPIPNPDYIIPVEIEGKIVDVYVLKRPWLDHFMNAIAGCFEVVVFTASLSKYAGEKSLAMDLQAPGGTHCMSSNAWFLQLLEGMWQSYLAKGGCSMEWKA